jgi:hypothetical protein
MNEQAEKVGAMVNRALSENDTRINLIALQNEWRSQGELSRQIANATAARPAAIVKWARSRYDPRIAVILAGFVPGLWEELIRSASVYEHLVGVQALWDMAAVVVRYTFVRAISRASEHKVIQKLAPLINDEWYATVALLSVRGERLDTVKLILETLRPLVDERLIIRCSDPTIRAELVRYHYEHLFCLLGVCQAIHEHVWSDRSVSMASHGR